MGHYAHRLNGEGEPELLFETDFEMDEPHLSPDGRWIAYASNESGEWEAYPAAFPSFTERRAHDRSPGGK